jgi:RNA polymerase sigma-70 factor (ECF subfamily)
VDDQQLVEAARRGNDRAFAVLVRAHERALFCTAYSILRSSWDASDAVQDAFLEAYARIEDLRDATKFKPWLSRILVNACYDTLGRRRRLVPVGEEPEAPDATDAWPGAPSDGSTRAHAFIGTEAQMDLFRAVKGLDEDLRTAIALRYFLDLKVDDIAAAIDVPSGTVKSRINRALTRLAQSLGRSTSLEVTQ